MLWNCPHCQQHITPKTVKSVKLAAEGNRRAMLCPACDGEVEMSVHPAEYRQLAIPALGLFVLWWASKAGTTASRVIAAVAVAAGLISTIYINKRVLNTWQRFRAPGAKPTR